MAACKLVLCVCLLGLPPTLAFLLDGDSTNSIQSLLSLINDEKKNRANLETEIAGLKNDIATMTASHQSSLCSCPKSGVVAFSATLTKDITNLGTQQPVVFDHVITNVGGAYDNRHGTFRAPVDGIYKFAFSVLQGTSTMWIGLELVKDGSAIGRVKTGDNGYWNMGTNVITAHLMAGDDVWVRHMTDSDSKHVVSQSGYFTMYTGHLIRAD